jgi:mRNA-degrading endonuclease YafQ of YafQ-DinJ toxin-antitoxin module
MAMGIERVVFCDLFWKSLDSLRGHSRYPAIRGQIDELIAFKMDGSQRMSLRDKPFNPKGALAGIWHWACCRNPDIVIFYEIRDQTLTMAMVGDHDDYAFQGRGARASARTATRIANTISNGHVFSPEWRSLSWKRPSDIISHPDLHELSKDAMRSIASTLRQELEDGTIFERQYGMSIFDAGAAAFDSWIEETECALEAVGRALRGIPTTPEACLELALERRSYLGASPAI